MSGLLVLAIFFGILAVASALGLTADSRDHDVRSAAEDRRWFARG
jgi:hypothetical protein